MRLISLTVLLLAASLFSLAAADLVSVDPVITAFYEFQNSGQCKDWVSLFSPSFSVVDPLGSPAVTSAADLLTGCTQTPQTFKVVSIKIMQAYSPMPTSTAIQWQCNSVSVDNCKLDFAGVDVFTLETNPGAASKIKSVVGYFDPSIPGAQLNCTHSSASA